MNFRETSYSHGVAETVTVYWSRSTLLDDSSRLLVTYSDGSPIIYHYSGAFGSNGVAVSVFLFGRGVPELVTTTLSGFHCLMVVQAPSTWGMRLIATELP